MKNITKSLIVIGAVAAIVIGGTIAYFSDTETSTGNTFTAGSIDLTVDSTQHYNGNVCQLDGGTYKWSGSSAYPVPGTACDGTWVAADLGGQKFFNFADIKPGDSGENTLSLNVTNNDAWGRMTITATTDTGDKCTEPETQMAHDGGIVGEYDTGEDADCAGVTPGTVEAEGELRDNTHFSMWLDQGTTPGFQGKTADPLEGDNVWLPANEPLLFGTIPKGFGVEADYATYWWKSVISNGTIEMTPGEVSNLWEALSAVYTAENCINTPTICEGLAVDGRLVSGVTYYFGMAWQVPETVGNEAQSDAFTADLKFEVVQQRNNAGKTF